MLLVKLAHDIVKEQERLLTKDFCSKEHLRHLERKYHAPLLPLRTKDTGIVAIYLKDDVIPVGSNRRLLTPQVNVAGLKEAADKHVSKLISGELGEVITKAAFV